MTTALPAEKSSSLTGLMFCSPWIVGVVLLFAWPFAASLYWSFCRFDMINPPEFVGVENYTRIADEVARGRGAGRAIANTLYYSLLSVPLSVALGVCLAVLLSAKVKGQALFRTLVFLPSIIPIVASSILWNTTAELAQSSAVGGQHRRRGSNRELVVRRAVVVTWQQGRFGINGPLGRWKFCRDLSRRNQRHPGNSLRGSRNRRRRLGAKVFSRHGPNAFARDFLQSGDGLNSQRPKFHEHLYLERGDGAAR